jgi:nitroreductase
VLAKGVGGSFDPVMSTDPSGPDPRGAQPPRFVPYVDRYDPGATPERAAAACFDVLRRRRSIRSFSDRPVSQETIEWLVRCAHSAPSGANKQPWRFVCVRDPATKAKIRVAAEAEEREFYERRASERWLQDLAPLGTDETKDFLTIAPWLVVVFQLTQTDDGGQVYYLKESVGLACGMFLAAAQYAGLATLTHTPSPMAFLGDILGRPKHERPFLLIPVGYPTDDCTVPEHAVQRRPLKDVMVVV